MEWWWWFFVSPFVSPGGRDGGLDCDSQFSGFLGDDIEFTTKGGCRLPESFFLLPFFRRLERPFFVP